MQAASVRDISLPDGFERLLAPDGSYAAFLQHLCLKTDTVVFLYNGEVKPDQTFAFQVIDLDIGEKNLQQCADAAIRLRAEYLFAHAQDDQIHFKFSNGSNASYKSWKEGYRAIVKGNSVKWEKKEEFDESYDNFRKYLNTVFNYAGSWSLDKELKTVKDPEEIQIGDLLIKGAFPGHVMMVVDLAYHPISGERIFLLAQSARPAQSVHIVKNRQDNYLSPWYSIKTLNTKLVIEEWTFYSENLKRF